MTMPNFLIIGAAKSGTTSLYAYLRQHPQVYMPELKEPKFFAYDGETVVFRGPMDLEKNRRLVTQLADYQMLFKDVRDEIAVGEATALYLYIPRACERIKHYLPDAKLFAILRNPVDRAYSAYTHLRRDGRETIAEFAAALREEERRLADNYHPLWAYKSMGFYHEQVLRYFNAFGSEQFHVFLHEDLHRDPAVVVGTIFRILGVDDTFVPDFTERLNESFIPRSRGLTEFMRRKNGIWQAACRSVPGFWRAADKIQAWNERPPPPCPAEVRRELVASFRDDILKLQDSIHRDLSSWLAIASPDKRSCAVTARVNDQVESNVASFGTGRNPVGSVKLS